MIYRCEPDKIEPVLSVACGASRIARLADVDGLQAVTPCWANSLCTIREFF